jgi:hypothetical protein
VIENRFLIDTCTFGAFGFPFQVRRSGVFLVAVKREGRCSNIYNYQLSQLMSQIIYFNGLVCLFNTIFGFYEDKFGKSSKGIFLEPKMSIKCISLSHLLSRTCLSYHTFQTYLLCICNCPIKKKCFIYGFVTISFVIKVGTTRYV